MQHRHAITGLMLALFVVGGLQVAAVEHERSQLDVSMTVNNTTVVDGEMRALTVRLTNHEPEDKTVLIRVWGLNDHRQHIWRGSNGRLEHTIQPGETRTVRVQRQDFALGTEPNAPVMVVAATPDGVERTHTVIRPAGGNDA